MAIEIVAPGLGCSVQDQGRSGHYDVGIPPSGALDLFSALAANLLVGNDEGAAVLEAAKARRRRSSLSRKAMVCSSMRVSIWLKASVRNPNSSPLILRARTE